MGYWEKRQEEMYKAGEMQVNQYFTRLEKAFNQAKRELQKTIEAFYFRYAKENGLSYAEAQKRLNAAELGDLQDYIGLVMQNIGKYNQTVNNLSIKARITRYQALEAQIDAILRQLYAVDYEAMAEQTMQEVYEESYYQTWYNIDQYRGFHSEFAQVEPRAMQTLLEYPFNGAAFSSRLWKQKDHLQTQLMEAVTTMMIQGKHPKMLAADFAKKMNSKKFDAYRLLHTESSFLMSEATHAGYKEDGVKKYQILATLDSKTCGMCGDLDRKVYEVGKEVVGVNMPPFHPLCRCTDTPYYDDTDRTDMTRAARDPETGKSYEVPADMTYKEWHAQYIEQNPDKVLAEKKLRNKTADKEQFKRYRQILGKDAPKDLDSFQNLKYNDSEIWKFVKLDYRRRNEVLQHPESKLPNLENVMAANEKFTKYLFGGDHSEGLVKGAAFTSRLGYGPNNWQELQKEILSRASWYPATFRSNNGYGDIYSQKIIIYGNKGTPANVVVGWLCKPDGSVSMSSAYIKEVKEWK